MKNLLLLYSADDGLGSNQGLNSRIKDYHDVWMLFRWRQFDPKVLEQALVRTFERRRTQLDLVQILGILKQYGEAVDRQLLWERYQRKSGLETVPKTLTTICDSIADVLKSLNTKHN